MAIKQALKQTIALSITAGFSLQMAVPVMASEAFGTNWQAKPLVDHSAAPKATSTPATAKPAASTPAPKPDAELEAKLKPAEPFIASIEKQMALQPKPGEALVNRLDSLQNVLFGESKYQDAGELLAQLASIFPAEAAKAHADLTAKMQNAQQQAQTTQAGKPSTARTAPKQAVMPPQQTASAFPQTGQTAYPQQPVQQVQPQKKKRFWESEDDPFRNDPFFQDQPSSFQNQPNQSNGPSRIGAIGQGLAGLAMMAGSVAGNYYLNRNNGGLLPNNGIYNQHPAYGNYGYPYGYGYGMPYGQVPYGQGAIFGQPTGFGQPMGYASPFGFGQTTVTTQPYRPYGTTTGGISPLGVPTGLYRY